MTDFITPQHIADTRGEIFVLENGKHIPFPVKRVYYLVGANDAPRGFHAHKELRQVAVCVAGSCRMMMDDGAKKWDMLLDKPNKAILIDRMVWHEMHDFTADCVLLVLASDLYNEDDYIRDYNQFKRELKNV